MKSLLTIGLALSLFFSSDFAFASKRHHKTDHKHHHKHVHKHHRGHAASIFKSMGIASWYGNESGNRTANGERFNPKLMTAAHRFLPFGTLVKVTNLKNKKSVVVRINDRGPFVRGRIIDLSKHAAKSIGMNGTQLVSLELQ